MEMIFHYADPFRQYMPDGSNIIQPNCFVFGQITTALEIEPTGNTGMIAVRFHPDGFLPFATLPIREMENRAVSLKELFGEEYANKRKLAYKNRHNKDRHIKWSKGWFAWGASPH